jgi:hypothetical protein
MYNSYAGPCNILNLNVSRHKKLDVMANNSKTWDYTNPLLPMVENHTQNGNQSSYGNPHHHGHHMQGHHGKGGAGGMMGGAPDHPLLPMPMNIAAAAAVAAAAAAAGSHPFNPASPFMPNPQQAGGGHGGYGQQMQGGGPQGGAGQNQPPVGNPYNQVAQSVPGYPMQSMAVVQVANFPEQVSL